MKIGPIEITKDDVSALFNFLTEGFRRIRVPKNKRGRVGIVIALRTEGVHDKKLLESDLVRALNHHLEHSNLNGVCHVIQFDERLSSKIQSPQDAERYVRRARAHFIIYGDFVERQIEGRTNYVIRLHGLVVHRPVPLPVSSTLGQDFREVLPTRIMFPQADEFLGLEATREWLGFVASYVIGIAAMISGDLRLAGKFFLTVEQDLANKPQQSESNPILSMLDQRVRARLIELRRAELHNSYNFFVRSRNPDYLTGCADILQDLFKRSPEDYHGKLSQAMMLFFMHNIIEAIRTLEGIRNPDATWRFSLGFLYAYDGQIDEALEQYRRAFYGTTPSNVIADTEMFISDVITRKPEKIQLFFFRGLINYKGKPDYLLAKEDFEHFLKLDKCKKYPRLIELAEKYLADSKSHVGV